VFCKQGKYVSEKHGWKLPIQPPDQKLLQAKAMDLEFEF